MLIRLSLLATADKHSFKIINEICGRLGCKQKDALSYRRPPSLAGQAGFRASQPARTNQTRPDWLGHCLADIIINTTVIIRVQCSVSAQSLRDHMNCRSHYQTTTKAGWPQPELPIQLRLQDISKQPVDSLSLLFVNEIHLFAPQSPGLE